MVVADFSISSSNQWSSVADLIEEIQDRIPEDKIENIFPVLNRAIRAVAKRLFMMKSDLIIGSLSLPFYAQVTYTASTIVFVAGTPATITDSANGFVTAALQAGTYITTNSSNNPGPLRITSVAAGTLTLSRDVSLTSESAGSSRTLTMKADRAPLADDFWGLVEEPYINGKTWTLKPSPGLETEIQYTSAGESYYFRVKGTDLWLIPATGSAITILGNYFKKPTKITQMEDPVPYAQLLDDVFQEYLVMTLGGGAAATDEILNAYLEKQVDIIVANRSLKAATGMPEGIDYSTL